MVYKADENFMENVWNELPKTPDDDHVTLSQEEVEFVWQNGFVDTDKYSLDKWMNAFEPHKVGDKYICSKAEFIEKDKFRFTGEIMIPFDPLLINEGKYTDEGLQELIDMSIVPSCSKSLKEIEDFFTGFKDQFREKDNLIRMDMEGKRLINDLVLNNPSPTRRREVIFDHMFEKYLDQVESGGIESIKATPEQASKVQMSTFTSSPTSQVEEAAKKLKSVEKKKEKKVTDTEDKGVEIKKVRKRRKGFRG